MQPVGLQHLGQTRSVRSANHALQTADTFIRTKFPGMEKAVAVVHASPALGAGFTQYTSEIEAGGRLGFCSAQRFLYMLDGSVEINLGGSSQPVTANGYVYIPQGVEHLVTAHADARIAVIEKHYQRLDGIASSEPLFSRESEIAGQPLMGDPDLLVRGLLPDTMAFDFAVNTMTYAPGAALSMVEMHVMEHGLLMLQGGGIYRLDDAWYPVTAGDFIWMGPYCPQWFGALGKTPAKYLIYKDWNRHPLSL